MFYTSVYQAHNTGIASAIFLRLYYVFKSGIQARVFPRVARTVVDWISPQGAIHLAFPLPQVPWGSLVPCSLCSDVNSWQRIKLVHSMDIWQHTFFRKQCAFLAVTRFSLKCQAKEIMSPELWGDPRNSHYLGLLSVGEVSTFQLTHNAQAPSIQGGNSATGVLQGYGGWQ